jgi:Mor family transcriptional regulator
MNIELNMFHNMNTDNRTQRDEKIHRLYDHGLMTKAELARFFRLSYMQISRILKRKRVKGGDEQCEE